MYRHSLSSVFILLSSVITLLLFCGCADDLRNRSVFDSGAGDAVIRFSIEDVTLTREGESEDIESVVDHAYLLFYSGDASLLTDVPLAAVRAEVDQAVYGNLKFKMPLSLTPNTDYQLLAIANADDYVPSGFENFGEYLESWCRNSTSSDKSPIHLYCSSVISPAVRANLPMTGGVSESSTFRFSTENGSYSLSGSLSFRRMVARIDVANILKEGFEVEGVALCNWRDAMPLASYDSQIGNSFGSVRGILSKEGQSLSEDIFVAMPLRDKTGIQQLNKRIYCFPSVSYKSSLGDQESTALIIKAKYGEDSESTYYRVNVGMQGNVSKVHPNTKYLVTIQSVKGRGAPTPEEAYFATESQIVLSVVEGWDLEGSYAMDDYGNFIVLSKGSLDFEGDATDYAEVRILTSKGLEWTAEYIADDNDASSIAFNVEKLSDTAIVIAPRGENEGEEPLTGKCMVSATTEAGTTLQAYIALCQNVAEEKPYEPIIPSDMPFALIPESYERVKIDHENRTIEIDGFDPDCFNSFIDIPFRVYINENYNGKGPFTITSTLSWPSEGQFSNKKHNDQYYCSESFGGTTNNKYSVYSITDKKLKTYSEAYTSTTKIVNEDIVYLSIGAMGPDDPAIKKTVTITDNSGDFEKVEYKLEVKPTPIIIEDVILPDNEGKHWVIFDRNVQDLSSSDELVDKIGRRADGKKWQAYNYLSQNYLVQIPGKYFDEKLSLMDEKHHTLYKGVDRDKGVSRLSWLNKYQYADNQERTTPFYEQNNIEQWVYPTQGLLQILASKMKVSKMRMYLVSDIPVKSGRKYIPVCCYWPYHGDSMGNTDNFTSGYYYLQNSVNIESVILIYCDKTEMKTFVPSATAQKTYNGLSRLVRPLTEDELDNYKQNYLGYGSQPHKLTICHPDTYESTPLGWIKY